MAKLHDFLGGLFEQIAKGRSQADLATLEVAKLYREHPSELLKEFPIPRLSLDEVVVDLKLAVGSAPRPGNRLSAEGRKSIINGVKQLVHELPASDDDLKGLAEKAPRLTRLWKARDAELEERLQRLLPLEDEVGPDVLAQGAASIISNHITGLVMDRRAAVKAADAKQYLSRRLPEAEKAWAERIKGIVAENLQATAQEGVEVLVTASELEGIPAEKVTSLKLTLRESDRSWTEYETEAGKTVS